MGLELRDIFFFTVHQALYFVVTFMQTCLWACNGRSRRLQRIKAGQDYENSAHVFDVLVRPDAAVSEREFPLNFIATHRRFVSPEYVLKPNVSLHSVSKDEAVFVEVSENEDIFDTRRHPFLFKALLLQAVRVIRLPIASLHRIAAKIGDPPTDKKVLFIHHTGRCGGTLLMQMLNRVPGSVCMSEIHWSLNISNMRDLLPSDEYTARIRSIFRIICKVDSSLICIKTFNINWLSMAQSISEVFPCFQQVMMYRSPLPHLKSRVKIFSRVFFFQMEYTVQKYPILSKLLRVDRRKILEGCYGENFQFAYDGISDEILGLNEFETHCLRTAMWYRLYLKLRQNGCNITSVNFGDLLSNTQGTLGTILDKCELSGLRHCLANMALAIHRDSQEGLRIGWAVSKQKPDAVISRESLRRCDELYKRLSGLPSFTADPWYLPEDIN